MNRRTIKVGKKRIEALSWKISDKNLVVLKGARGFVMCGYLNMKVANAFGDVAVKISGVTTIGDALSARVRTCSKAAHKCGIRKNQAIKDVLTIIA